MKSRGIIFCKLPSLIQSLIVILVSVLFVDFIKDHDLDNLFVISNISVHAYIAHLTCVNVLFDFFILLSQVLSCSASTIFLSLEAIYIIYLNIVLFISVLILFNIISNTRLLSRFSTLHIDATFNHHKEVIKAFINIP